MEEGEWEKGNGRGRLEVRRKAEGRCWNRWKSRRKMEWRGDERG